MMTAKKSLALSQNCRGISIQQTVSAGEQIITIETEKSTLKFGANDLGTWFISYKEKEAKR